MWGMFEEDENFEETLRSIAREAGRSIERAIDKVDVDDVADAIGVDATEAREWFDSAAGWLRAQAESLGEEVAQRASGPKPKRAAPGEEALLGARPHPLDLPTDEQGAALAALDSGRWTVEPGSEMLAARGDGPEPSDALGIVRELRARDWLGSDGKVTLAGRHALRRWLDEASKG